MNVAKNYQKIIYDVFRESISLPDNNDFNNCTGALADDNNYIIFKNNFIERLKRIKTHFSKDSSTIRKILNTVKQIGLAKGYKWSGPYSELVALDYWIQYDNIMNIKYVHKGKVDEFENSIAKRIGQKEVDIDISLDLNTIKLFMDVKSLIPTHLELIDKILDMVKRKTNDSDYLMAIDDLFSVDYLQMKSDYIYELQSGDLIDKLSQCVNDKKTFYKHELRSGDKATFRIAYAKPGSGMVLTTKRTMDPYRLAKDYRYKALDYFNKLLISQPSCIVFVINPWFNKEMSDFMGMNQTFYRALARRIFFELGKRTDNMEIYYPELINQNLKICDIAGYVSGIIFIEDKSIQNADGEIFKSYIYTNPNAKNKILNRGHFEILDWSERSIRPEVIDDFMHDNY